MRAEYSDRGDMERALEVVNENGCEGLSKADCLSDSELSAALRLSQPLSFTTSMCSVVVDGGTILWPQHPFKICTLGANLSGLFFF